MRYNGVIERKLALLDSQVLNLERALAGISREVFVDHWGLRSMAERALQVCVEIVVDVAERILAIENAGPAASAAESLAKLVTLGVLKSAAPYADMVRFRNLIVHQYEVVDPALLYSIATQRLGDFRRFRDEIDAVQ